MGYSEHDAKILPLAFIVIVFIAVILAFILRNRSERVRGIPTAIIAVILLLLEVIKQRWNIIGEFDAFYLPFHYCSMFFLIIPLAELCGEKSSRIFRPIGVCMAFIVSVSMYVFPQGILGKASESLGQSFYRTHTFVFHHLIVLYFVLTVALRLCRPSLRHVLGVGIVGAIYSAVALPLSYGLETNYCNFLESVIPIMESFRVSYGQAAYTVLQVFFITVGTALGALIYVALFKLFEFCIGKVRK